MTLAAEHPGALTDQSKQGETKERRRKNPAEIEKQIKIQNAIRRGEGKEGGEGTRALREDEAQ